MSDEFSNLASSLVSPALGAAAITPSDSVALATTTRAIYVGTAGNLRAQMLSGEVVTFTNLAAGSFYPFRVTQVLATGTTASGLVGLR